MTHDVFISHSSKDKAIADAVCAAIESEKIRCWITPRDILPGEKWASAITKAISNTRIMVLIFSPQSNNSEYVLNELVLAKDSGVIVIPFKIGDVFLESEMKFYLQRTHWLDATDPPTKKQMHKLVETVILFLDKRQTKKREKTALMDTEFVNPEQIIPEIDEQKKESEEQEKRQKQLNGSVKKNDYFTKCTIIASGTGAGKLASLFFIEMKNESIGDKIIIINSNHSDIINLLIELENKAISNEDKMLVEQIRQQNTLLINYGGVENLHKEVDEYTRKDFKAKIFQLLKTLGTRPGDVILEIFSLASETGAGSIPFIIHQMEFFYNQHIALAILPDFSEPPQMQFNSICGLTRLLKYGDNSKQNADMVLLVDYSKIASDIKMNEGIEPNFLEIDKRIIQALDLLFNGDHSTSKGVVDIKDYTKFPSMMNMYHFTLCPSIDNDINLIRLDVALDAAVNNSFVKIDPKTAVIGYLIIIIPEKYLNENDFTNEIHRIFNTWKKDNIIGTMAFASIKYSYSKKDTFDLLLLLGGFSLKHTLEKPLQDFNSFKRILLMAFEDHHNKIDNMKLSIKEIEDIETTLNSYISHTENVINKIMKETEN